jgi:hypothetical protein
MRHRPDDNSVVSHSSGEAHGREALKYGAPAAVGMFHWSFLAAPYPIPETLIGADPKGYLTLLMGRWVSPKHGHKVYEALDAYIDAYGNEGVIRGACEDYRAGASIDIENEKADLVDLSRTF